MKKTPSKESKACIGLRNKKTAAAQIQAPRGRTRSPKASQVKETVEKNAHSHDQVTTTKVGKSRAISGSADAK